MEYINCLEREYEDTEKKYFFVEFCISRYGGFWRKIHFDEPVTEKTAIKAVEDFMNQPLDREYYEKIKNNTFPGMKFEEYETRGDILCSCKFLEIVKEVTEDEKLGFEFYCGS